MELKLKRKQPKPPEPTPKVTITDESSFKVTKNTTARGMRSMRRLTPARSFKLFEDQLDAIESLRREVGVDFNISDVIRDGVDLAIADIKRRMFNREE